MPRNTEKIKTSESPGAHDLSRLALWLLVSPQITAVWRVQLRTFPTFYAKLSDNVFGLAQRQVVCQVMTVVWGLKFRTLKTFCASLGHCSSDIALATVHRHTGHAVTAYRYMQMVWYSQPRFKKKITIIIIKCQQRLKFIVMFNLLDQGYSNLKAPRHMW